ncbi:oxidoreductase, Rv2161c family [Frankia torreyi]|uniref:Oxidoreductase, Rv2161c family n=1 Tax=Frankia torreyi TaxID=1856 RepID=A0A0D8BMC8_9ACTN|nr:MULTISPECIES: LLM class F420-dependent oxidoreductase [Frankia]KJE25174.1 oxidoreductase, Rv2161c family [Frankia torreyi]KQC37717.1 dehydrogenase [Frankia sp. ACN1ag]
MRFAVQHAVADPAWSPRILTPDAVTGFARAAEESGFAALGFSDHPAPSARWVDSGGEGSADPLVSLAFCAAVTSRIRLFTWALVAPYRSPLLTAHQVATLDALSAGRLTLTLGAGYLRSEFGALGVDFDGRLAAFDETVDVLRASWEQPRLTHSGRLLQTRGTNIQPRVVQQPHPPLWLHGNSAWGRERAVRYGQGVVTLLTNDTLARTIRTAAVPGVDGFTRVVDDVRARLDAAGRPHDAVDVVATGMWPQLDVRQGWDAAAMLDDVATYAKLGADWIVIAVCGDDPAAAEDTVRRFGEEIVAHAADPV